MTNRSSGTTTTAITMRLPAGTSRVIRLGWRGGGVNTYAYAKSLPTKYVETTGLWSLTIELGWRGRVTSLTIGESPTSGGAFLRFRFGAGVGGGISFDRNGSNAAQQTALRDHGTNVSGIAAGGYANVNGTLGITIAEVDASAGSYMSSGADGFYADADAGLLTATKSGVRRAASVGVEMSTWSDEGFCE